MHVLKNIKQYVYERMPHLLLRWYHHIKKIKYNLFGRAHTPGETSKAHVRREQEGFFEKYCQGSGLDIGYGGDLIVPHCVGFDWEDGDAQTVAELSGKKFDFVYTSHVLEHLPDPHDALKHWWQLLRPGGYLIIYIPHRDLYEKKKTLPSDHNPKHLHYFLIEHDEPPVTIGVAPLIHRGLTEYDVQYIKECASGGEYSIEAVIKKKSHG